MQGKKFISPGAWFSMNYPSDWNEFEDGEGSTEDFIDNKYIQVLQFSISSL